MKPVRSCSLVFVTISSIIASGRAASLDSDSDRVLKGKPLSDHEHNDDLDHDYDHEAFLGDEAAEFDELSPEESQRRLGEIVDRIDVNGDGQVSVEELQQWIHFTQSRYKLSINIAIAIETIFSPFIQICERGCREAVVSAQT